MSQDTTRRTFLKLSGLGLAATATPKVLLPSALPVKDGAPTRPAGDIAVWVTSGKPQLSRAASVTWSPSVGKPGENAIMLDPGKQFQEMLGFGAAFTDAACYMFHQLPDSARGQLFHELFHPAEMGLNVCRTCIGSSDYSTELFSYDEGDPDLELKRFSIDHDRAYVLPILRQARKENPNLFLLSSPWSPPGWMKAGGSMLGGSMRPRYFASYAQYFLKFLQAYAAEGVPVQAVSVQNEVDTDQDGRMPACLWPQEYEIKFVKDHLGPLLRQNSMSTKIWILDHNYNLWGRAICELDDEGLRKYCNAIAWHGYVGAPEMASKVHQAHPDAQMYWTEGGPDYTSPRYSTDWVDWGRTFTQAIQNWCQAIVGWNLALDEKGRPNIGPFPCGGMVTINSQTKEISRSGQYWALAHFSRAVRRGARRFKSKSEVRGLEQVGFVNPDAQKVLILTNAGPEQTVSLRLGDAAAEVSLAPDSLTTLVWS
jgi:glucosylceramidase